MTSAECAWLSSFGICRGGDCKKTDKLASWVALSTGGIHHGIPSAAEHVVIGVFPYVDVKIMSTTGSKRLVKFSAFLEIVKYDAASKCLHTRCVSRCARLM